MDKSYSWPPLVGVDLLLPVGLLMICTTPKIHLVLVLHLLEKIPLTIHAWGELGGCPISQHPWHL